MARRPSGHQCRVWRAFGGCSGEEGVDHCPALSLERDVDARATQGVRDHAPAVARKREERFTARSISDAVIASRLFRPDLHHCRDARRLEGGVMEKLRAFDVAWADAHMVDHVHGPIGRDLSGLLGLGCRRIASHQAGETRLGAERG